MVATGNVSIPGTAGGVLTIEGKSTLNNATAFASVLLNAQNAGTLQIDDLDHPPVAPPGPGETLEYTLTGAGIATDIPTGGAYLFDNADGSTTVTGSGAGDTVLAALAGTGTGGLTYVASDGSNAIIFVSGDNIYNGAGANSVADSDTITAGEGRDTINTGAGEATVFSGIGGALITLNDTTPGTVNDDVLLSDGVNTVNAQGAGDLVFVTGSGQTVNDGSSTRDRDQIVISPTQQGGAGGNVINGGAAQTLVFDEAGGNLLAVQSGSFVEFDEAGGNSIAGGSGTLYLVSGPTAPGGALTDTVQAGTGINDIFGPTGSAASYDVISPAATTVSFIDQGGSETINALSGPGTLDVFGGSSADLVVQGGAGTLNFVGAGASGSALSATISAGSGLTNIFGAGGESLTLLGPSGHPVTVIAGLGNETLDGSGFSGNLDVFASNPADNVAGPAVSESLVGGSGANFFLTGAGNETIVAGSGVNLIQLSKTLDGVGGTITIFNYSASDAISFNGFTTAEENDAIRSAAPTTNGLIGTQLTLSDSTSVLFVDVNAGALKFDR